MSLTPAAIASPRQLYQGQPLTSVAAPSSAPTLGQSAGGSLPAGTYYVKYTWLYPTGQQGVNQETAASPEASLAVSSGNQLNVTLPSLPAGAVGANIYIGTSSGSETKQNASPVTGTTYAQTTAITTTGAAAPSSGPAAQILYTAPGTSTNVSGASATAYITEIDITNTGNSSATFSLYLVPSGGTAGATNALIYNGSITANDFRPIGPMKIYMPPGSTLQASQNTAGVYTLTINGAEVQ
jgi:hypothetical protein